MRDEIEGEAPIRLLLVDDHFFVLRGLVAVLVKESDIVVVGEANDGLEAIEAYREHEPDLVIMDYQMPHRTGVEATVDILREFPEARVLILSISQSEEQVFKAMESGARGYLFKTVRARELLLAIRTICSGDLYLQMEAAAVLAKRISRVRLSKREDEVLQHIAQGMSNKEIAMAFGISITTVKTHVGSLLLKLDVQDRTQALVSAVKRGLVDFG